MSCPHASPAVLTRFSELLKSESTCVRNIQSHQTTCAAGSSCTSSFDDLWMCVSCLHVGCSRSVQRHALHHSEKTKHPVVVRVSSPETWCFACDDEPPIESILSQLDSVVAANLWKSLWPHIVLPESPSPTPHDQGPHQNHRHHGNHQRHSHDDDAHRTSDNGGNGDGDSDNGDGERDIHDEVPLLDLTTFTFPTLASLSCRGLPNLGNTCYLNSALQVLLACRAFTSYFSSLDSDVSGRAGGMHNQGNERIAKSGSKQHYNDSSKNSVLPIEPRNENRFRLVWAWAGFCAEMQRSGKGTVSPAAVVHAIKAINPSFRGYSQQDSQELIRCFLDNIDEEICRPVSAADFLRYAAHAECIPSDVRRAVVGDRKRIKLSIVRDVFGGKLLSSVTCCNCQHASHTVDDFLDISLSIPSSSGAGRSKSWFSFSSSSSVTLQSCLDSFFAMDTLEGKNAYKCEKCKSPQKALKRFSLLAPLPNILMIHLKRFEFRGFTSSKIKDTVAFSMSLDMSPYLYGRSSPADSADDGLHATYKLIGVVNHHGGTGGGHYTAMSYRYPHGWFQCDDSSVSSISPDRVLGSEGYVLVYELQPCDGYAESLPSSLLPGDSLVPRDFLHTLRTCPNVCAAGIRNFAYTCPHGRLGIDIAKRHFMRMDASQFHSFLERFGGGPEIKDVVSEGEQCSECVVLERRREKELADIQQLDSTKISKGSSWYLISSPWIAEWRAFVSGERILPPGPIENEFLLDTKKKYKVTRDFRGINEKVWGYLLRTYGGGPVILRKTIDLYDVGESKGDSVGDAEDEEEEPEIDNDDNDENENENENESQNGECGGNEDKE
eukprot:ANDGO_00954.mRNA.1 putative ubiquitin carboxyl-terminal hydrolase 16